MSYSKLTIALLVAFLSLSSTSFARTHFGTIVLKDGRQLEHVQYKVKTTFRIIEVVKIDNKDVQQKYKFKQISALLDKNGKDVTRKYLGSYARTRLPKPTNQDSLSTIEVELGWGSLDNDESSRKFPTEKLWNLTFRAGSSLNLLSRSLPDGRSLGVGYGFNVRVPITRFFAIRGGISQSEIQKPVFTTSFTPPMNRFSNFVVTESSSPMTRISVAGEFYFFNRKETYPPSYVGFIYTGIGASIQRNTVSNYRTTHLTRTPYVLRHQETSSNLFSSSGIGFDTFFNSRLGLEFAINMDVFIIDQKRFDQIKYTYLIDLRLGAIAYF